MRGREAIVQFCFVFEKKPKMGEWENNNIIQKKAWNQPKMGKKDENVVYASVSGKFSTDTPEREILVAVMAAGVKVYGMAKRSGVL